MKRELALQLYGTYLLAGKAMFSHVSVQGEGVPPPPSDTGGVYLG